MTTKHTPGPWIIDHHRIGPWGEPVALLCDMAASSPGTVVEWPRMPEQSSFETIGDAENEANARLLSSAPLLLAALEEVASLIESYCDDWNSDSPTDVTVVLPKLQAAIFNATTPLTPRPVDNTNENVTEILEALEALLTEKDEECSGDGDEQYSWTRFSECDPSGNWGHARRLIAKAKGESNG